MSEVLNFLRRFSVSENPLLTRENLNTLPENLRAELLDGGYIVPAKEKLRTIWDDDEPYRVESAFFPDGAPRYFYILGGRSIEVAESELALYHVTFQPFAYVVRNGLNCRGGMEEKLPGKVWLLGAAGQQRREVYLVRNFKRPEVFNFLMDGAVKTSSIIIHIGERPSQSKFAEEQIFSLDTMLDFDGEKFSFDGECVFNNLRDMVARRPAKLKQKSQPKQRDYQARVETCLKAWFRMKYSNAQRRFYGEHPLPERISATNQKELARWASVPAPAISRMKKTWQNDLKGSTWIYYKLIELLSQKNADFLDFFHENHTYLKKIGIEY